MQSSQIFISIITPCYNESQVVVHFLERLEKVLAGLPVFFQVVVVDDCSSDDTLQLLQSITFNCKNIQLTIVTMPGNSGHQAAIYKGMVEASRHPTKRFIIMDADGQDAPEVIAEMLTIADADIVHVVRSKRNESLLFRSCYFIYRMLFRVATGQNMNYGNFCMINRVVQKVIKRYIVAPRSNRIGGRSKMGFIKLVKHALRSFLEYRNVNRLPGALSTILISIASINLLP